MGSRSWEGGLKKRGARAISPAARPGIASGGHPGRRIASALCQQAELLYHGPHASRDRIERFTELVTIRIAIVDVEPPVERLHGRVLARVLERVVQLADDRRGHAFRAGK